MRKNNNSYRQNEIRFESCRMKDEDFQRETVLYRCMHEIIQLIEFKINSKVLKFYIIIPAKMHIKK